MSSNITMHPLLNDMSRSRSRSSPATMIGNRQSLSNIDSTTATTPFSYHKDLQKTPSVLSDLIQNQTVDGKKELDFPTLFLMKKMKQKVEQVGLSPRNRSQSLITMMKHSGQPMLSSGGCNEDHSR